MPRTAYQACLVAAVATGLAACTQVEVRPTAAADPATHAGFAYRLDFTQYTITVTRSLAACVPGKVPTIKVDVTVAPGLAPDDDQLYVIDPRSMISAFKTSDVSADFKDGRLVGFNASTVDKSGDVVTSVITSAAKIATLAATGLPVAEGPPFDYCTEPAHHNLQTVKDNKQPIDRATADLADATGQLTTLTAQYAAKPTEKLRIAIKKKTEAIAAGQKKLDALTKATSDAQAWLTEVQTYVWPRTSRVYHEDNAVPLAAATSDKWLRLSAIEGQVAKDPESNPRTAADPDGLHLHVSPGANAALLGIGATDFATRYPALAGGAHYDECIAQPTTACGREANELKQAVADLAFRRLRDAPVSLHIVALTGYGGETAGSGSRNARDGLRYRLPAVGVLFVCDGAQKCFLNGTIDKPIVKVIGPVAQLGTVFNIPFSSPAFASGGLSVTFDDQGRLLHAGLKRDTSTALVAANLAGTAVDQSAGVLSAIKGSELKNLENETKIANAKKTLADAQAALVKTPAQQATEDLTLLETQQKIAQIHAQLDPSLTKDLTTQVGVAQLEIQLAELQQKLAVDPDVADLAVKQQYDSQTQVLLAKKASLEADAAVIAAQQTLNTVKAAQP